jgi:hypothetical protein
LFLKKSYFFFLLILDEQVELGLSKEEIAKRVQTQLNNEYAARAFEIIENSTRLNKLSPGLGRLLVSQARSILTMKSVVAKLTEDLDQHLATVFIILSFFQITIFDNQLDTSAVNQRASNKIQN